MKTRLPKHAWMFIPFLLAGAVVLVVGSAFRTPPGRDSFVEFFPAVETAALRRTSIVPTARGFGSAEPPRVHEAIAEISARIVEKPEWVESGRFVEGGDLLFRLDKGEVEIAVEQTQAQIESVGAQLARLEQQQANDQQLLEIESARLGLAQKEFDRQERLFSEGGTSEADLDGARSSLLAQNSAVRSLQNSLALYPAQKKELVAQLRNNEAQLEQTKIDLERTELRAPFDGRIREVFAEASQFASRGELLLTLDDVSSTEVNAQFPGADLRRVLDFPMADQLRGSTPEEKLAAISGHIEARVLLRLGVGEAPYQWQAQLLRVSPYIDPETLTIGVVVATGDTWKEAVPGVRPPLVPGAFCEVVLESGPMENVVLVPRAAWLDGELAIVDDEGKIDRLKAAPLFSEGDFFVFDAEGLPLGSSLVLSDVAHLPVGTRVIGESQGQSAERATIEGSNGFDQESEAP